MSILVSICCITYNHEKYIADAIEGFLMQKTDFPIEIIMHDDASTDRTPEIIRSYHEKHPDLIKPIFQTVNQYSQGIKIGPTFTWPRARGKYIAVCEGDDYWTDPYKLQKQVDYMESHPETTMCFHAAKVIDPDGRTIKELRPCRGNRVFSAKEIILGGGGFFATASVVFKKSIMNPPPEWFFRAPVGDYPLAMICASQGPVYYIDDEMAVYRHGVPGSWTDRMRTNANERYAHRKAMNEIFDYFDIYTNHRFSRLIHNNKSRITRNYIIRNHKDSDESNIRELLCHLNFKDKSILWVLLKFPAIYKFMVRVKRFLRNNL